MGLATFCKNIKFLFKNNLKQTKNHVSYQELIEVLEDIPLLLPQNYGRLQLPQINDPEETIAAITEGRRSICRFGDGEFKLMEGEDIPFQKGSPEIANRLHEVFASNNPDILIGIHSCLFKIPSIVLPVVKLFYYLKSAHYRHQVLQLVDPEKTYCSAEFTQLYMLYENYDFETYYRKMAQIWNNRDITIICGRGIMDKITHNIFDSAASVEYIYAPSQNAFDSYDDLLKQAKQIDKNRLVIIILGPTATVLAYDLALCGYQALDFGHIFKDYDAFIARQPRTPGNIGRFYKPD